MPRGKSGKVKVGLLASEEPPKAGRKSAVVDEMKSVVPLLREQAGTWYRVAEFESPNGANGARHRLSKQFPKVEWTGRCYPDHSVLYARWTG